MPNELRFAVGTPERLVSSVWRLWGKGDDLYLGMRSSLGIAKISFHQSGICRYAQVSTAPRPAIQTWRRKTPGSPGQDFLFKIIVANRPYAERFSERIPPPNKRVRLIDPPACGEKVQIALLPMQINSTDKDILQLDTPYQLTIEGRIRQDSEVIWLLSYRSELTPAETRVIEGMVESISINLKAGSDPKSVAGATAQVFEATDPPVILDLALGPDNVHVTG